MVEGVGLEYKNSKGTRKEDYYLRHVQAFPRVHQELVHPALEILPFQC
jgi:hypothetical protein